MCKQKIACSYKAKGKKNCSLLSTRIQQYCWTYSNAPTHITIKIVIEKIGSLCSSKAPLEDAKGCSDMYRKYASGNWTENNSNKNVHSRRQDTVIRRSISFLFRSFQPLSIFFYSSSRFFFTFTAHYHTCARNHVLSLDKFVHLQKLTAPQNI